MKKIFLLFVIILPFVLTSCGDDKDEPQTLEQQLIGKWVTTRNELQFIYQFNSDHTGSQWYEVNGERGTYYSFPWSLDRNILTITYMPSSKRYFEISIEGDLLKMIVEENIIIYHKTKD